MVKKVLVVDDSRIMRNIVKNAFSKLKIPHTFVEADNGKDALRIIKEDNVDIVFLDWNMPALAGIDVLQAAREAEETKKLPIIMVTSEADRYSVISALKTGATHYLVKPVSEDKFISVVNKVNWEAA